MAKKKSLNLRMITKITTAAMIVLIFACLGLTARFIWTSLTSLTQSADGSSNSQFRVEGIDMDLLEDVEGFRNNRQTRPDILYGQVRDPFYLPPVPPAPAPTEVQPPAAEQPTETPAQPSAAPETAPPSE